MPNKGSRAEVKVKRFLEKEIGVQLNPKTLVVGYRSDKKPQTKSFDLVSEDNQIVGEVKSYKLGNKNTGKAGYTTTRKQRLITACWYLEKIKAKKKILALTNKELYNQFIRDMDGLLAPEIEVRYIR